MRGRILCLLGSASQCCAVNNQSESDPGRYEKSANRYRSAHSPFRYGRRTCQYHLENCSQTLFSKKQFHCAIKAKMIGACYVQNHQSSVVHLVAVGKDAGKPAVTAGKH